MPLALFSGPLLRPSPQPSDGDIGCVVIGRNEGERLRSCLRSLVGQVSCLVYVDSGSTDGSVECAAAFGAHVVRLDPSVPFTAAHARDAGYHALLRLSPECRFVQFVDGDCEVAPTWLAEAAAHLRAHPETGIVAGRQRERDAQRTPYHRILDVEWDTPRGVVLSCAGNAMMRVAAYAACGGFRRGMIAGEEPELCLRVRRSGYRIEALDVPMAVHDAGDVGFCQWWRRSIRAGHAMAEAASLHGRAPERHGVRESVRTVFGRCVCRCWHSVPHRSRAVSVCWHYPWVMRRLRCARSYTCARVAMTHAMRAPQRRCTRWVSSPNCAASCDSMAVACCGGARP